MDGKRTCLVWPLLYLITLFMRINIFITLSLCLCLCHGWLEHRIYYERIENGIFFLVVYAFGHCWPSNTQEKPIENIYCVGTTSDCWCCYCQSQWLIFNAQKLCEPLQRGQRSAQPLLFRLLASWMDSVYFLPVVGSVTESQNACVSIAWRTHSAGVCQLIEVEWKHKAWHLKGYYYGMTGKNIIICSHEICEGKLLVAKGTQMKYKLLSSRGTWVRRKNTCHRK